MGLLCPKCALPIKSWAQHLRQRPACRGTAVVQRAPGPQFDDRSSSSEFDLNAHERRRRLADVLSECRYEKCWSSKDCAQLKVSFGEMYDAANLCAFDALRPLLQSGVSQDQVLQALTPLGSAAFAGLETRDKEFANAKVDVPYLVPRVVHLAPGGSVDDQVVSFSQKDLLVRDLQNDPFIRRHTLKMSDEFKSGKNW